MRQRYLKPALAVGAIAFALIGLSWRAPALPGKAGDPQDQARALQERIDATAAAGGGVVHLPPGLIEISKPLLLRDNVTLEGSGRDTVISSARYTHAKGADGTVLFVGSMLPPSYHTNHGNGYPDHDATRVSETSVDAENCAANPPQSGQVVWVSTPDGSGGAGGWFRPTHGEINLVTSIEGCRITLADPLSKELGTRFHIGWADGSQHWPGNAATSAMPIRNAGVRDLSLYTENGQALIMSGCYSCLVENVHIARSRRLLMVEGARHTQYRDISGFFSERGIEFAMFATDNVVRGVRAEVADRNIKMAPPLRFGENAERNLVEDVILDLKDSYARSDMVRLDDGCCNRLDDIHFKVAGTNRDYGIFLSRREAHFEGRDIDLCRNGRCNPIKTIDGF